MLTLILLLLFTNPSVASASYPEEGIEALADSLGNDRVVIDKIFIVGNKKTKDRIILRELDIRAGEVYDKTDLEQILVTERNKIFNLQLFNTVKVTTLALSPNLVDIVINVSERWYLFPSPIFSLVDRNFNDWWQNQDHDLSRTNYGIKIFQNNFRGRNETLKLTLQFGFTRNFGLSYSIPYIDKSQRHGLSFGFDYAENKNISLQTVDHFREFYDSEELLRLKREFFLSYRLRNSFYTTHRFTAVFESNAVNDTIASLNPAYYKQGETTQRFFSLKYRFHHDKRDIQAYPLNGYEVEVIATKYGLGIFNDLNFAETKIRHANYKDLGRNFFLANYSSLYFSGINQPPYSNLYGLGYKNDFVRGYELYVIEAKNFYLHRATLRKRLFAIKGRFDFVPVEQFREWPLAVYLKGYFDMAYVQNIDRYQEADLNQSLSERYLYGTGFGLDFVSSYDTVIRLEYSFNRENESGFFFHLKKEF